MILTHILALDHISPMEAEYTEKKVWLYPKYYNEEESDAGYSLAGGEGASRAGTVQAHAGGGVVAL
jgi:hypothetical protein